MEKETNRTEFEELSRKIEERFRRDNISKKDIEEAIRWTRKGQ